MKTGGGGKGDREILLCRFACSWWPSDDVGMPTVIRERGLHRHQRFGIANGTGRDVRPTNKRTLASM
jgi:hypothetical protein